MTNTTDLAALRRNAEAATPGPWLVSGGTVYSLHGEPQRNRFFAQLQRGREDDASYDELIANARHIAALDPQTVLALLSELEALREREAGAVPAAALSEEEACLLDGETFRKGIREDGTVEGYPIETFYLPCKAIGDDESGFLRVLVDDNATDAETRVPHSALRAAGWLKAANPGSAPPAPSSAPEPTGLIEAAQRGLTQMEDASLLIEAGFFDSAQDRLASGAAALRAALKETK